MPKTKSGETQISTLIAKDVKERLEHLDVHGLKTLRAKLEYLINCAYQRQRLTERLVDKPIPYEHPIPQWDPEQPRELVDESVPYHTHTEPVYGPGSGYEPWQPACTCDNPCTYQGDRDSRNSKPTDQKDDLFGVCPSCHKLTVLKYIGIQVEDAGMVEQYNCVLCGSTVNRRNIKQPEQPITTNPDGKYVKAAK